MCDYATYLMYVGLGYLATICLRHVLFFLVLRKGLRESLRPRFTTRRMYAVTTHTLFTATRYPSLQDCKTGSAKLDSLPTGCIYKLLWLCRVDINDVWLCVIIVEKTRTRIKTGRGRVTD